MTAADTVRYLPVFRDKFARSWPTHALVESKEMAVYTPLVEALTRSYDTDAHFCGYSVPHVPRRLGGDHIFAELADGATMVLFVGDVDWPGKGETDYAGPSLEEWWQAEQSKLAPLLAERPGAFIYRTSGGYRFVYQLARPFVVASPRDKEQWKASYLAWLDILLMKYQIKGDRACKDWTRFYRLPFVVRDGKRVKLETFGDPNAIGTWAEPMADPPAPPPERPRSSYTPRSGDFDIYEFMAEVAPGARQYQQPGRACWDVECPNEENHSSRSNRDSVVSFGAAGPTFNCLHDHCGHLRWADYRKHHQPDWVPYNERPQWIKSYEPPRPSDIGDEDPMPEDMPPRCAEDGTRPPPHDGAPHAADREPAPTPAPSRYRMTEIGNGERFAAMHGARFRFVHGRGWSLWDGKRWASVERGDQMTAAKAVVAELYAEASALSARASRACNTDGSISDAATRAGGLASALIDHARKSSKATALEAMLKLAQSEAPIAASRGDFDGDPWAFNVANGTLDLRTGQLRPHRQTDMITKLAPIVYDPAAPAKRWETFLARVLPDPELLAWMQRFAGYCLTGAVSEQALAFGYGTGANGKNVLLDTVAGVMGDYAIRAAPDLLLSRNGEAHPTQEADLDGARLVLCSEIDEGRAWNEALIKRITGDRRIRARKMGKDFYEFPATHKLIVAANAKPKMRGTDNGIWRRMNLIPFSVTIPPEERIKDFDQLLLAEEAPGILAWLVRGCLAWQSEGLGTASAISEATATYREEQDVLGQWIAEECVLVAGVFTPTAQLYKMFHSWCERAGRHPWTRDAMREGLIGRDGIAERRSKIARGFDGIGIAEHARQEEEERQAARRGGRGADRTYQRGEA